jgi:hypothetical protein
MYKKQNDARWCTENGTEPEIRRGGFRKKLNPVLPCVPPGRQARWGAQTIYFLIPRRRPPLFLTSAGIP